MDSERQGEVVEKVRDGIDSNSTTGPGEKKIVNLEVSANL